MKKIIKPALALSALILFLISANAAVRPLFGGARGNEWDALFHVPPFREVAVNDDAGGAALGALMSNDPGGNDSGGRAGAQNLTAAANIKDCASRDSLPLLSALLALLFIYAALRVARRHGWPFLSIKYNHIYAKLIESMRKVVTKF